LALRKKTNLDSISPVRIVDGACREAASDPDQKMEGQ
jgi:hypothetical protein